MAQELRSPIADLLAEVAAEDAAAEAAAADKPAAARSAADDAGSADAEGADGERSAAEAAAAEENAETAGSEVDEDASEKEDAGKKTKGKKAASPRMVPVERLNEEAVKRRKLEKSIEDMQKRLDAITNPPKPEEKPAPRQRTEEEIRAQARADARLEIQLENFVSQGNSTYTKEAFDAACNKISDLVGGPSNLIAIAIEATGSERDAAKAIYTLGQEDAPEIESFLKLSPIRQAAALARLATTRAKGKQDDPPARGRRSDDDEPPAPIRPVKGASRVEDTFRDEMSDKDFFRMMDEKILKQPRAH